VAMGPIELLGCLLKALIYQPAVPYFQLLDFEYYWLMIQHPLAQVQDPEIN
jgi:hypothetical protein